MIGQNAGLILNEDGGMRATIGHRICRPLCVTSVLAFAMTAQAASFDCAKAGTMVEHIICDNPKISQLDENLAKSYKAALQDKSKAEGEVVKEAQKQWMKERNKCANAGCVKLAYKTRLSSLNKNASAVTAVAVSQNGASSASQPIKEVPPTSSAEDKTCLAPRIDWRNYEWTLIRGSGQPVCEEMLSYLKSRPADVAPPTCPEERLPSNGNWTRPESRILSEAEKQNILRDIPERWKHKPVGVSYERQIKDSGLLRVIRGDITRDGIPETFLAFHTYGDYRQLCEKSKRCARPEEIFHHGIVLHSDSYDLLPMNDAGTQVNWSHRTVGLSPALMGGVLVYYKGLPYWMSAVSWNQSLQDNFVHNSMRPDNPYSAIFSLSPISSYSATDSKNRSPNFNEVTSISIDRDPESNRVCRFGYFNRENLKLNPPNARK